jgi:DnaJ-class molecular chaperone
MADPSATTPEPGDCLACRATGQVVSNLGGEGKQVPCPWCEGSGVRLTGHDAQARWRVEPVGAGAGDGARAA